MLVGQSRGGFVALELARTRPDLARALVLTNSASIAPRYPAWKHREDFGDMLGGPENLRHDLEWLTSVHDRFTDDYIAEMTEMLSSEAGVRARELHAAAREAYFADFEAAKLELVEWLRSGAYDKPVLLIWGADDPMTYLADALEIFDLLRAASPMPGCSCSTAAATRPLPSIRTSSTRSCAPSCTHSNRPAVFRRGQTAVSVTASEVQQLRNGSATSPAQRPAFRDMPWCQTP